MIAMPRRTPCRHPVEGVAGRRGERGPQQQVLGRVARDRELGHQRDVGSGLGGVGERPRDPAGVALDVADDGVELGQRDAQRRPSGFVADPARPSGAVAR